MCFLRPIIVVVTIACASIGLGQGVHIETAPGTGQSTSPTSAAKKPVAAPTVTPAEALYDYWQKYNIEVVKDESGPRLIWTDRVLLEIAEEPPPEPLAKRLSTAPSTNGQLAAWVHDTFETNLGTWHAGKRNPHPRKKGTDELVSVQGEGRCFVNPVYLAYILARYPEAGILIKGPTDPALFTVNGQLRAVVSPWTKLPDGTPLQ